MLPKRVVLDWLRRRELLVFGIIGFAVALALVITMLFRDVRTSQYAMRSGNWISVQIEVEFQRFLRALARYSFADPDVSYQDLTRRLDILWSRVLLTGEGAATRDLRDDAMFGEVIGELDHALRQVEPFVQELSKGDIGAYRSIAGALQPLETRLHQLVQHLIMQSDTMAREGDLTLRYQETLVALLGVLATALAVTVLLLRERRRSDSRALAERHARERAQSESFANTALMTLARREMASPLARAGRDMAEVLDSILDMARLQSGTLRLDPGTIDLGALVLACGAAVEPWAAEREVVVLRRLDPTLPPLRSDARLLRHVVLALLSAAVARAAAQGRIEIVTGCDGSRQVFVEIQDDGAPIPAEDLGRAAVPAALGEADLLAGEGTVRFPLVIARGFSDALGATLSIASAAGATVARVTVPAMAWPQQAEPRTGAAQA